MAGRLSLSPSVPIFTHVSVYILYPCADSSGPKPAGRALAGLIHFVSVLGAAPHNCFVRAGCKFLARILNKDIL